MHAATPAATALAIAICAATTDSLPAAEHVEPTGAAASTEFHQAMANECADLTIEVGRFPYAAAVADLDTNGTLDLVIANNSDYDPSNGVFFISLLFGAGDGSFSPQQKIPVLGPPYALAVGDFDTNGLPDLAVANRLSDVSILLANGDGTFAANQFIPVGDRPRSVATADFNDDGCPDLAVANMLSNDVSVLLGNCDGTFALLPPVPAGAGPHAVAVGDFDTNGVADLAVANSDGDNVSILLGQGDGAFGSPALVAVGARPRSLAVGDFDSDGRPDVAVANFDDENVSILLGNGDGTFAGQQLFATPADPYSIAVADLNDDQVLDLAVTDTSADTVSILLGDGLGSFSGPGSLSVGDQPIAVTAADLDTDGAADLVVSNSESDSVSILLNACVQAALGDCNNNGVFDSIELDGNDCNTNHILDECETAPSQVARRKAADPGYQDEFGFSVAVSGETAIVGSPFDDDNGANSGSAYVFGRINGQWQQVAKLIAADGASNDEFGRSVAIDGLTAVIGARNDDDEGSAYIFREIDGLWQQVARLSASDASFADAFGSAVSISGDTVIIGAPGKNSPVFNSGVAYVFREDGGIWRQIARLSAVDAGVGDFFGISVSVSGDTAIIGAFLDDDGGSDTGSAYVFREVGGEWQQIAKLTADDPDEGDSLGYSVSLSGDTAVIGARGVFNPGLQAGSAYIFREIGSVWQQVVKLLPPGDSNEDRFGSSVAISGDTAVVGDFRDDSVANASGAAYVYRDIDGVWQPTAKLIAADAEVGLGFGRSVAISGDTTWIGAGQGNGSAEQPSASGTAYVFRSFDCNRNGIPDDCELAENDCNANGVLDACDLIPFDPDADGHVVPDCNATGVPDDCELTANDCNSNGLPDECELITNDCDANGIPDDCDLDPPPFTRLVAADPGAFDFLGNSVAISGDTAVVGAFQDNADGLNSGSAAVYGDDGGNWQEINLLTATDAAAGDLFGFDVAISGTTAIIGAPFDDDAGTDSGSAYIFTDTAGTWQQFAKLTASDASIGEQFGMTTAVNGDTAIIGTGTDPDNGNGSVYVFRSIAGTWQQLTKLLPVGNFFGARFGASIALSGQTVLVGAPGADWQAPDAGFVVVYQENGSVWGPVALLAAGDAAGGDNFGQQVAIDGALAVVGAPFSDGMGAAYIYREIDGAWQEVARLTATDAAMGDMFGASVAVNGGVIVVGAARAGDDGTARGATFVFREIGGVWIQDDRLTAPGVGPGDQFGYDVSVSGNTAIVGAVGDGTDLSRSGAAYIFNIADDNANGIRDICEQPADCNNNGAPDILDIAAGTSLDCNTNGIPDECDLSLAEIAKLTAVDASTGDSFGIRVDLSGQTAVIGADFANGATTASGSAYVFGKVDDVWQQVAELTASDGAVDDRFGFSVDISGATVLVGSFKDDDQGTDSGSVYVFRNLAGNWQQAAKLTASDAAPGDWFGVNLALHGDTAVIGARQDDDNGSNSGSAYVFRELNGTWQEIAKLTASDGAPDDLFGIRVAVSGTTAIVSAIFNDAAGSGSGAAYVFHEIDGAWQEVTKLVPVDAMPHDAFGNDLALDGDTAVIASQLDDDPAVDGGSVYVFRNIGGTWQQVARLAASDGAAGDRFGVGVSIRGDTAVIGALFDDDGGTDTGSAYVFREIGGVWQEITKLTASDAADGDRFGTNVAVSGTTAVIGANRDDDGGSSSGSAYVFDIPLSSDCNNNGVPDECDPDPDCNANGVLDDCEVLDHMAIILPCFTGPCLTTDCAPALYHDACCSHADINSDGAIDLRDFAEMTRTTP